MNLAEMDIELEAIIQDADYTSTKRRFYINQAYTEAIAQVRVPSLKRVGQLSTIVGQAYTSILTMDANYGGWISRIRNANLDDVTIYSKIEELMDHFDDFTVEGQVVAAAVEDTVLWYQYVPTTAETLTVVYFTKPSALVLDSDSPDYIPSHLHFPVVVNGAAALIYNQIEDGQVEDKANFRANLVLANQGLTRLHEWVGRTRPHHITSTWSV